MGLSIIGCGGAGCNMLHGIPPIPGFEPIALNDEPHPSMLGIQRRVFVSRESLKDIAETEKRGRRELYTEVEKAVEAQIRGSDIVFIVGGLGGYTGTWASSIVADVARHCRALAVSLVSLPFSAEGLARRAVANEGLKLLRRHSDVVVTFPNDGLLKLAPNISLLRAFEVMGKLIGKPIVDLASVLTRGDIPHLRSVLRSVDEMRVGMGKGTGDHRNFLAVEDAFTSPWFDMNLDGVKEVLLLVSSQYIDPKDIDDVLHEIGLRVPKANITWGSVEEDIGERTRVLILLGT